MALMGDRWNLTATGAESVLEQATQEAENAKRRVADALVALATTLEGFERSDRIGQTYRELSGNWWDSMEGIGRGLRFVVLTRLARAGVDTPIKHWEEG